jgi:tetratricopeptide (TPR) repeat protein
MQGDFETARDRYRQGLEIRRGLHDEKGIANLLTNLGIIAHRQGNYQEARILYEEGLDLARRLGDKWTIGVTLINLGYVALDQDDYAQARTWLDEAVSLHREVGDRAMTANALNNLANVARAQADYAATQSMYEESLNISWALGDKVAIAYLLEDIGCLLALQGLSRSTLRLVGAARSLRESIGAPLPPPEQTKLDQILLTAREALGEEASTEAESQGREMTVEEAVQFALRGE